MAVHGVLDYEVKQWQYDGLLAYFAWMALMAQCGEVGTFFLCAFMVIAGIASLLEKHHGD